MTCVRVAAVGDLHVGLDSAAVLASESLAETADVLLVAGDLTRHGTPAEAEVLAAEVATVPVPVVIVLGNHDYESDAAEEVRAVMESAGATVLDGDSVVLPVGDVRVGIAGTPGFGGGFRGASCSEFGEPLMKAFVGHTRAMANALCHSLAALDADVRIAMTHYSPDRGHPRRGAAWRSIRSSAATCSPRRSTPAAPTSPSTAMPTAVRAPASHRAACRCAMSPAPCSAGRSPCCGWTLRDSPKTLKGDATGRSQVTEGTARRLSRGAGTGGSPMNS